MRSCLPSSWAAFPMWRPRRRRACTHKCADVGCWGLGRKFLLHRSITSFDPQQTSHGRAARILMFAVAFLSQSVKVPRIGLRVLSRPAMRCRGFTTCLARAVAGVAGSSLILAASSAITQQHHHPPEDQAIHERFYSTWMMPDRRTVPCCNTQDCSPAESRIEDGNWVARKVSAVTAIGPSFRHRKSSMIAKVLTAVATSAAGGLPGF